LIPVEFGYEDVDVDEFFPVDGYGIAKFVPVCLVFIPTTSRPLHVNLDLIDFDLFGLKLSTFID